MSKYSVTITNEDGTNEIFLADNYKEISDKINIPVGKITRIMTGITKFHKKEAKELLGKFKIEKIPKVNDDDVQKINELTMQNNIKVMKINSYNNEDKQYMQNINKDIYNIIGSYPCITTFNEHNILCNENEKIDKIIEEIKNNITNDTLCVLLCNKIAK